MDFYDFLEEEDDEPDPEPPPHKKLFQPFWMCKCRPSWRNVHLFHIFWFFTDYWTIFVRINNFFYAILNHYIQTLVTGPGISEYTTFAYAYNHYDVITEINHIFKWLYAPRLSTLYVKHPSRRGLKNKCILHCRNSASDWHPCTRVYRACKYQKNVEIHMQNDSLEPDCI